MTMAVTNKWSKGFWVDLAERVAATFIGAVIGLLTLSGTTPVEWDNWNYIWTVVGLPVAFSILKGLAANLKDAESGASFVDAPPGPVVVDEQGSAVVGGVLGALGLGLLVLAIILLFTTLLKIFVVSWGVVIAAFVIGLILVFLDGGFRNRL